MSEKEFICLSETKPLDEDEVRICPGCSKKTCDACGGDVITMKDYDEAEGINASH